jgi:hypothetical protein
VYFERGDDDMVGTRTVFSLRNGEKLRKYFRIVVHAAGGAVGCGTVLQAGRLRDRLPMVSLEFFIDTIFPAAL